MDLIIPQPGDLFNWVDPEFDADTTGDESDRTVAAIDFVLLDIEGPKKVRALNAFSSEMIIIKIFNVATQVTIKLPVSLEAIQKCYRLKVRP